MSKTWDTFDNFSPGWQVNTRCRNSTKNTSSEKKEFYLLFFFFFLKNELLQSEKGRDPELLCRISNKKYKKYKNRQIGGNGGRGDVFTAQKTSQGERKKKSTKDLKCLRSPLAREHNYQVYKLHQRYILWKRIDAPGSIWLKFQV